jgi:hypothetical protein
MHLLALGALLYRWNNGRKSAKFPVKFPVGRDFSPKATGVVQNFPGGKSDWSERRKGEPVLPPVIAMK